jgi:SAM-dependent methyltransferase
MIGPMASEQSRTIDDFGEQWSHYGDNQGYYGSLELLRDMLGPLLDLEELRGARVAEVGAGAGRVVHMLLSAGAEHVVAVEPSQGVEILRANTREQGERVQVLHLPGEALPADLALDFVFSIGVLPFVPDPQPLLRAARNALRPGGRIVIWVYGVEGNRAYLALLRALRAFTTRVPHAVLDALCRVLNALLGVYIWLCRWLPLPLRDYARGTLARLSPEKRHLTIYDQLNPSFVRFFREAEVRAMLEQAGFRDVRLYHRRGYSWTALGVRDTLAGEAPRVP